MSLQWYEHALIAFSSPLKKDHDPDYEVKKPYQFGYEIEDGQGNMQHRHEQSDGSGAKRGSYGYVDANGIYRKVEYVADEHGFRVKMSSNEPGNCWDLLADFFRPFSFSGVKDVQSPSVSLITQPINTYTESPVQLSDNSLDKSHEIKPLYSHDIQPVTPSLPALPPPTEEVVIDAPPSPPPSLPVAQVKSYHHDPEEKYFTRNYKKPHYSEPLARIKYLKKNKFYPNNLKNPSTNYATHYDPVPSFHHPHHHYQISSDSTEKQQNVFKASPKQYDKPAIYLENENELRAPYEDELRNALPLPPPPPPKREPSIHTPKPPTYQVNDQESYEPLMAKPHFEPIRVKHGEPVMPLRKRPSAYPPRSRAQARLPPVSVPETIYSVNPSDQYDMKPKVHYERPEMFHKPLSLVSPPENERYHHTSLPNGGMGNDEPSVHINKLPDNERNLGSDKGYDSYRNYDNYLPPNNYVPRPKQAIYPLDDDISRRKSYQAINEFKSNLRSLFPYMDRNKQDPYGAGPLVDDASEPVHSFLVEPASLQQETTTPASVVVTPKPKLNFENYLKIHGTSLAPIYRD